MSEVLQGEVQAELTVPFDVMLPDAGDWTNRFRIKSETSNRLYIVAQHKKKGHFGCSCPGWRAYRHCKHLKTMGIPGQEQPFNMRIVASRSAVSVELETPSGARRSVAFD